MTPPPAPETPPEVVNIVTRALSRLRFDATTPDSETQSNGITLTNERRRGAARRPMPELVPVRIDNEGLSPVQTEMARRRAAMRIDIDSEESEDDDNDDDVNGNGNGSVPGEGDETESDYDDDDDYEDDYVNEQDLLKMVSGGVGSDPFVVGGLSTAASAGGK